MTIKKTSKRKRDHKVSKGINGGGGKVTLSYVQKILMNKGAYQAMKPIGAEKRRER